MRKYDFGILINDGYGNGNTYMVVRWDMVALLIDANGVVINSINLSLDQSNKYITSAEISKLMNNRAWVTGAKPIEEQTYKVGDIFKRYGSYYMIVQPTDYDISLLNVETGNRWTDKLVPVKNPNKIVLDEMLHVFEFNQFKYIPTAEVVVKEE